MKTNQVKVWIPRLYLAAWLGVSLIGLAGLWSLWWGRERVLYAGKSPEAQRIAVFKHAGLPVPVLSQVAALDEAWAPDTRYAAKGNADVLSYVKYLLIPRIPAKDSDQMIVATRSGLRDVSGVSVEVEKGPLRLLFGFPLSMVFVVGLALWISRLAVSLSWPERTSCALLVLGLLVVGSRVATGSAHTGCCLFAGLGAIGYAVAIGKKTAQNSNAWNFRRSEWGLSVLIGGFILWSLVMAVVVVPDDWDAWAIWGAKAKVLALGEGPLQDVMRFGHADYPLLWPAVWAFSGWCAGGWEEQWSKGWSVVFLLLGAWQIAAAIQQQTRRRNLGLLGAAFFVSMPAVPLIASWAYAESLLWLMMTCGFARLLVWRDSGRPQDLWLAGLFAAGAAHTKNEGVAFAVLALIWLILNRKQSFLKEACAFLAPILLLYVPWIAWVKLSLGLGSHATAGLKLDGAHLRHAASRLPEALRLAANIWSDVRQWNIVLVPLLLAGVWLAVRASRAARLDIALPLGLLLVCFLITVFHDAELGWQMGASWNRLTLQAVPLLCMAVFSNLDALHSQKSTKDTKTR